MVLVPPVAVKLNETENVQLWPMILMLVRFWPCMPVGFAIAGTVAFSSFKALTDESVFVTYPKTHAVAVVVAIVALIGFVGALSLRHIL